MSIKSTKNTKNTKSIDWEGMIKNRGMLFAAVLFVALARLIPHPPNFTPIFALCLFSARRADTLLWALLPPALSLLLSNLFLGMTLSALVTLFFCLLATLLARSSLWRKEACFDRSYWIFGSVFLPLLFFLVSNGFVWYQSALFSKDLAGLISCYLYALPFALAPLSSTLFYSVLFFEVPLFLRRSFARAS